MPTRIRSVSANGTESGIVAVPRPPQVEPGDVLYAIHSADVASGGLSAPEGWSSVGQGSGDLIRARVWRRTAVDDEPDTYRFRQSPITYGTVIVIAVSGVDPGVSPRVAFLAEYDPGGGVTTPTISPTAATHLEVRVASGWATDQTASWTPPSGYAVRQIVDADIGIQTILAARSVNSSAPSGQKQFLLTPDAFLEAIGITLSVPSAADGPVIPPGDPFTPGRSQSRYRYRLKTWSGIYLDDLELTGVTFDKRIGEAGSFGATIPIPNRKVAERVARVIPRDVSELGIGPGVITVEIYRDGVPWGEYWITGAQLTRSRRGTPGISLRGSTMDAYLNYVELQESLQFAEDQIDIARGLLAHMQQGQTRASINLVLQPGVSGVSRERTYAANEASYGQRLQELAAVDNGFEWTINIVAGPAGLERHWVWGYPRLGSSQVVHVWGEGPYGGDILEWSEEIDAVRGATMWRARGDAPPSEDASTESVPLISSIHEATAHLAAGWPRIDRTLTYSSVTQQQTLEDYAAYWAATAPGALRVDAVTVALSSTPSFTPNSLGDMARLWFDNEWHLPHSRVRRIIGVGITPTSRESGIEEAQLIFEGLEVEGG